MKLYVKDNEKMTDEYYQMKEYRYDVLLELNDKYYQLNFMTSFLINQEIERDHFEYMRNLIPVKTVSLSNIIEVIKDIKKHDLSSELVIEKKVNLSEWIEVYTEE